MKEKKLKIDNFSKEQKKEMGFSFKDWNYEGSKVSRKRNRNPRGAKFVWKEDWSWFKHTHENRFDSIKNQTKLLPARWGNGFSIFSKDFVKEKDHKMYKIVWGSGLGKSIKVSDLNKKHLVEEIYHKYIKRLENSNDIGFVFEYWTSEFDQKWTGYHSFGEARTVLMKELIRVSNFYGDWMLLSVDIRHKLNVEDIKINEAKEAAKVAEEVLAVKKREERRKLFSRPIAAHKYIRDFNFRCFHKVVERLPKRRRKIFRDLEKCYLNRWRYWDNKDGELIKNLTLKLVGIYYIPRLGLKLKVVDKSLIRARRRTNRKIYSYDVNSCSFK